MASCFVNSAVEKVRAFLLPCHILVALRAPLAHDQQNRAETKGEDIQRTQNKGHVVVNVQRQVRIAQMEAQILERIRKILIRLAFIHPVITNLLKIASFYSSRRIYLVLNSLKRA